MLLFSYASDHNDMASTLGSDFEMAWLVVFGTYLQQSAAKLDFIFGAPDFRKRRIGGNQATVAKTAAWERKNTSNRAKRFG